MINTPDAKHVQKFIRIGSMLCFGVQLAQLMHEKRFNISDFTFGMTMNMGLLCLFLLTAIFMDKKQFAETQKIKSFTSTVVAVAVITLNIGLYFWMA